MDEAKEETEMLTLVTRKGCFGLPTACPKCLPVYLYLRFSRIRFDLEFNLVHPDSDQLPYVECGTYVVYNNEKGGIIQSLKEDGIIDVDSDVRGNPEWVSAKAMVDSWLTDAVMYELWVGSDGNSAYEIYYSDLPWPIGKILYFKQIHAVKRLLGITKDNADRRAEEIYRKAAIAYGALSTMLADQTFFFESRPTSLDAVFLGHALFALYALPETSALRSKLLENVNLVRYAENLKLEFIDGNSSSIPQTETEMSAPASRRGTSSWRSKAKSKPKKEKTEEEKKFRRRAKYFLVTQLVAVLVFISLFGGSEDADIEVDGDDDALSYD